MNPTPGQFTMKLAEDGSKDIGIIADGGCIAEVFHEIRSTDEGAFDEQMANARLFVASKYMLATLRSVLRQAVAGNPISTQQVIDAINKATGKE